MRLIDISKDLERYDNALMTIASKPVSFYREGIRQLPERWQKVFDANGDYFDDKNLFVCFLMNVEFCKKAQNFLAYLIFNSIV